MVKKIGLALSGGGARGFAHIGAIKKLEENNIPIDLVSGTSIGAVVGALYCSGYSGEEIEKIAKKTEWKKLIDITFSKKGFLKGDKIEAYLKELLDNKKFSDLKKPLFITAVDLNKKQEIIFNKGDLVKAIRASISLPGIFVPVEINNRILVDGGVLDNLPVEILKENDAGIIIAINLNQREIKQETYEKISKKNLQNTENNFNSASLISESYNLLETERTRLLLKNSPIDIMISPDLRDIRIHQFQKIDSIIKRGYDSCEEKIKEIKLITEKNKSISNKASNLIEKAKNIFKTK